VSRIVGSLDSVVLRKRAAPSAFPAPNRAATVRERAATGVRLFNGWLATKHINKLVQIENRLAKIDQPVRVAFEKLLAIAISFEAGFRASASS